MLPWILLDRVTVAGEGRELKLMQRGNEFSIRLDHVELMNSRAFGSEEALATATALRLGARKEPRVLIGGLGMGFTLRAALGAFDRRARITVCELVPAVVAWAKAPLSSVFGDCLRDPRVAIVEDDVRALIASSEERWDAILLDVDNGPEALTRASNRALYTTHGASEAHRSLRPGGVLSVWSAGPDTRFTKRLRSAGFDVEERRVRGHGKRGGAHHVLWLATKR